MMLVFFIQFAIALFVCLFFALPLNSSHPCLIYVTSGEREREESASSWHICHLIFASLSSSSQKRNYMSLIHRTTHCGSNKVIKLNFVGKKCIVGEQQHGFKENKSTATAGLFLQSLIA